MAPPTASQKVLDTTELLEHILLQLSQVQIFGVQRVCAKWKDVVEGSGALQERMLYAEFLIEECSPSSTRYELDEKLNTAMHPFSADIMLYNWSSSEHLLQGFIRVNMDQEWFNCGVTKPTSVAKLGVGCEDEAHSWNKVRLSVSGAKLQYRFSVENESVYGAIVNGCTLRELVESCRQGWERIGALSGDMITRDELYVDYSDLIA